MKGSAQKPVRCCKLVVEVDLLPQLAVLAMKEGVEARMRWSSPIIGAPSEPLKEDPEPETQRYFVETVCERKRWNKEMVEP